VKAPTGRTDCRRLRRQLRRRRVKGGLAGADGGGYGGGAGSSTAPGLTNPAITTADQNGNVQNGSVVLSAAN
jgi:hypothetical protein